MNEKRMFLLCKASSFHPLLFSSDDPMKENNLFFTPSLLRPFNGGKRSPLKLLIALQASDPHCGTPQPNPICQGRKKICFDSCVFANPPLFLQSRLINYPLQIFLKKYQSPNYEDIILQLYQNNLYFVYKNNPKMLLILTLITDMILQACQNNFNFVYKTTPTDLTSI